MQEEAKLSLAGAQSKMGLYLERKDGVGSLRAALWERSFDAYRKDVEPAFRAVERKTSISACALPGRSA